MASRYWVGGNSTWDATAGTKWALTSGGAGGQAVPTSSDTVYLDNGTGHGDVTITGAGVANCTSLICTGYTGTLTFNASTYLNIYGSITLVAGMTLTMPSTAGFNCNTSGGTLTSAGKTIGFLSLSGTSQTWTFADDWNCGGILQLAATTAQTLNGYSVTATALNVTGSGTTSGTTSIILTTGSGFWQNSGGGTLKNNLTFNGPITLTAGNSFYYNTGTLTYTSGTIVTTGTTLYIGANTTLNTNGMSWESVTITAACTVTLNSSLTGGTLTMPDAAVTFAGTGGYWFGRVSNTTITAARTYTFTTGNTYTTGSSCKLSGTATYSLSLVSSSGSTTYNFNLVSGCTQDIGYVTATRVNSLGGQAIFNYKGTLTTASNWITTYPVNNALVEPAFQVGM